MRCNDIDSIQRYDFPNILVERVPGTPGHEIVKEVSVHVLCVLSTLTRFWLCYVTQYIVSRLGQLDCSRWNVTQHSFNDSTPYGMKTFTNIIATLDPEVDRRLVLAAHYDSKLIKNFLGATDSALSVALLLDLALTLDQKLRDRQVSYNDMNYICVQIRNL